MPYLTLPPVPQTPHEGIVPRLVPERTDDTRLDEKRANPIPGKPGDDAPDLAEKRARDPERGEPPDRRGERRAPVRNPRREPVREGAT